MSTKPISHASNRNNNITGRIYGIVWDEHRYEYNPESIKYIQTNLYTIHISSTAVSCVSAAKFHLY